MDQTIEDPIAQSGIREASVPVFHRDLSGHQGGGSAVAIIEDLQQISGLRGGERCVPRGNIVRGPAVGREYQKAP